MSQFGPKLKLCFELLIPVPSSPRIRRCKRQKKKARKTKDIRNMRMKMKTRLQNNCKNLQIRVIFFCEQRYWQIVGDRKAATFILLLLDDMMRMRNEDEEWVKRMMTTITNSKIVLSWFKASWVSSFHLFPDYPDYIGLWLLKKFFNHHIVISSDAIWKFIFTFSSSSKRCENVGNETMWTIRGALIFPFNGKKSRHKF